MTQAAAGPRVRGHPMSHQAREGNVQVPAWLTREVAAAFSSVGPSRATSRILVDGIA